MKFELSEEQEKQWDKFQKEHKDCCKKRTGRLLASPTGGGHSIIFTPTGIGTCVRFHCPFCGKMEDVTDYESW